MSMSLSEPAVPNDPFANDPYAWIDRFAADLHVAARDLVRTRDAGRVSDEAVAQLAQSRVVAEVAVPERVVVGAGPRRYV